MNSSEAALEELMRKGFVNVNEYDGGMRDYKKTLKINLFIKYLIRRFNYFYKILKFYLIY